MKLAPRQAFAPLTVEYSNAATVRPLLVVPSANDGALQLPVVVTHNCVPTGIGSVTDTVLASTAAVPELVTRIW